MNRGERSGGRLLVVGGTGLAGRAVTEHFESVDGWEVYSLARRQMRRHGPGRHLTADLLDPGSLAAALHEAGDITHVFYGALYEAPDLVGGWRDKDQMDRNLVMLRNLMELVAARCRGLRQVVVLQGMKIYGSHIGPVRVPAREIDEAPSGSVFYSAQAEFLRELQRREGWQLTFLRPQGTIGLAVGSPMNLVAAIGVYAAIWRELGRPLSFPGGGRHVRAATDARVIGAAVEFLADHDVPEDVFNLANGDAFTWQDLWPSIAAHFGMEVGPPLPMSMAEQMPQYAGTWNAIVGSHQLAATSMSSLVSSSWQFADRCFAPFVDRPDDYVMSTNKIRRAGFNVCIDTDDSFLYWLERMQEAQLLPK